MYSNIFCRLKLSTATNRLCPDLRKILISKRNNTSFSYCGQKLELFCSYGKFNFSHTHGIRCNSLWNINERLFHGVQTQANNSDIFIMKCKRVRFKSTKADTNVITETNVETDTSKGIYVGNVTPKPKEIFYADSPSIREARKLFPTPKIALHNFYQAFYSERNETVSLSPAYKTVKVGKQTKWICMYHIFWPEDVKFVAKDDSKKEASSKAALLALDWLKSKGKLTDKGDPILYDKEEVKQLAKKDIPSIALGPKTLESIQELVNLFENDLLPTILNDKEQLESDEPNEEVLDPDEIKIAKNQRRLFLHMDAYVSREKVELPIAKYKEDFVNLLKNNQTIIVRGQPGCGKSTRIPQYVLEAWAEENELPGDTGLIAVTQPRRIAAISLAQRVAEERDEPVGKIVGYQVRLNSNFRSDTGRILYCTTGILLRNLQSDPDLTKFSHIILDEAHERDVNTDLLMNLVKRALKRNRELKLIVMSATIDTDMFSKYFEDAVVMDIPGFTHHVEEHFLDDCKIDVSKTLKVCSGDLPAVVHEEVVKILEYIHKSKPEGAILCFLPGWEDISRIHKMIPSSGDVAVYCLHSRLQDSDQWKIFSKPPPGIRKIILATNIAETSVTIDDVVYVVDTGIQKDLRFDVEKGINCIDNHWISKANARQRKGRAGRVRPGESYHLYTKEKFHSFDDYMMPEIQTTSLNKIILDCKVFSNNMNALEFMSGLPTPPDQSTTLKAVEELSELELLDSNENLTPLGKTVAGFQLEPKLAKAMINAVIFKCVTPIVDIVTLFSAETEFFVSGLLNKSEVKHTKSSFCKSSDHLAMMRLFEKWLEHKENRDSYGLRSFCEKVNLVPFKMNTVEKLRKIHFDYLYNGLHDVFPIADDMSDNDELVKGVLFSGVGNVLQRRNWDIVNRKLKFNANVLLTRNNHKATITTESVNFNRRTYPSGFLTYINETRSNIRRTTLVRECSLIPNISVLLFSNKKLIMKETKEVSLDIPSENQVELILSNTNIKILCDREQAEQITKLKDATISSYQYFIKQLTDTGKYNSQFNHSWDNFLHILGKILDEHSIP